jgi:hypothetical protein
VDVAFCPIKSQRSGKKCSYNPRFALIGRLLSGKMTWVIGEVEIGYVLLVAIIGYCDLLNL